MRNGQQLETIRGVYGDPQRAFMRSGPKLGADLVVVAIAILDEVARLRELLEPLVAALGPPERRAAAVPDTSEARTPTD